MSAGDAKSDAGVWNLEWTLECSKTQVKISEWTNDLVGRYLLFSKAVQQLDCPAYTVSLKDFDKQVRCDLKLILLEIDTYLNSTDTNCHSRRFNWWPILTTNASIKAGWAIVSGRSDLRAKDGVDSSLTAWMCIVAYCVIKLCEITLWSVRAHRSQM